LMEMVPAARRMAVLADAHTVSSSNMRPHTTAGVGVVCFPIGGSSLGGDQHGSF
jgi:hypothetical protein